MVYLIRKKIRTSRQGKHTYKKSDYWYIRYRDIDSKWKDKKAFKNKVVSTQLMAKVVRKIEYARFILAKQ
jgi:hypothetical protein